MSSVARAILLFKGVNNFLCWISKHALMGKRIAAMKGGSGQAKSHERLLNSRRYVHTDVVYSSNNTMSEFGMHNNSQKKNNEQSNKKKVRNGVNMKLPTKLANESGRPQAKRIGQEQSVKKS